MSDIYSPGQAKILFQFWHPSIEWFVIGGPADANEAQTVKAKYPAVQCVAIEPNAAFIKRQAELGFEGTLYEGALYDEDKEVILCVPLKHPRGSTLNVLRTPSDSSVETVAVSGRTLDSLSKDLGPFNNCCLWLDIEGSEKRALKGAKELLESGNVLLVNIEMYHKPANYLIDFMCQYGLEVVETWNTGALVDVRDVIFRKKGLK